MDASIRSLKPVVLIFTLIPFSTWVFCLSIDTISPDQQVREGDSIVSAGGVFELGFFSPNGSDARYVGIWYREFAKRVVWVANRENPLLQSSSSGVLMIGNDGNLVVIDGNSSLVWSTEINAIKGRTIAVLDDIGNLVLRENTSNGLALWQSFDHPSDFLLPKMKMGLNRRTGDQITISSWKNEGNPSMGYFEAYVDAQELPQIAIRNGSVKHYRSGQWNGRSFIGLPYLNKDYPTGFNLIPDTQGSIYFSYASFDDSVQRPVYLNSSGSFVILDWNSDDQKWMVSMSIPNSPCDVYNTCGTYARCNDEEGWSPICRCLNGYEPRNAGEWKKGDWTGGCVRAKQFRCERNDSVDVEEDWFLEFPRTKLPDYPQFSSRLVSADKGACESLCLKNCSCVAYAFVNDIGCMFWTNDMFDIQSFSYGGELLYLRLSDSERGAKKSIEGYAVVLIIIAAILGLSFLSCIFCRWRTKGRGLSYQNIILTLRRTKPRRDSHTFGFRGGNSEVQTFSLKEIEAATENFGFSNKLGEGGFGPVYRGKLPNGQEIAVKRLSRSSGQGIKEFENEVILISKLQHRNLVNLIGYCLQEEEKLLVYEYLSNKSLDKFIFGTDPIMGWSMRYNIIEGIARGLLYLHRDSRLKIIHRDLKTSNILLDEEMNPKISDFGMARIFGGNQATANTNRVVGTYGYMSPEYAMQGVFSEKSDVFSLGVVILEIVTGKKNFGFHYHQPGVNLSGHAWQLWNEQKALELLDTRLVGSYNQTQVIRCIHVGLLCVQDSENDRPTMSTVVSMLSNDQILPCPNRPLFSINHQPNIEKDSSLLGSGTSSRNAISETVMQGR